MPVSSANSDTVRINRVAAGSYRAVINDNFAAPVFSPAGTTAISISTLGGNDTIIIESTDVPVTINGGDGNDTVRIGHFVDGNHTLANITADITIADSPSGVTNTIEIHDNTGPAGRTYTIDNNAADNTFLTRSGSAAKVRWNGTYGKTTLNMTNNGGAVTVNKLVSSDDIQINGGTGADTVTVAPAGGLATVMAGKLRFDGNAGNDTLNLSDANHTGASGQTFTLFADRLTRTATTNNVFFGTLENLNLTGSAFAETINLQEGPAGRNVNITTNGGTADAVIVTPTSRTLSSWASTLTMNGSGTATLSLDDGNNGAGRTFNILNTLVTSAGLPSFNYSNLATLEVVGGVGGDTFNIASNPAGRLLRLSGNAGADTFNLGSGANMQNILGQLAIFGDGGTDSVIFSDVTHTVAATYGFTRNSGTETGFSRGGTNVAGIMQGVEALTVDAGIGSDTVNLFGVANGVGVTVNGGFGNDTVHAGNGNIDGLLPAGATFNGGNGNDLLTLNDQTDADAGNYLFDVSGSTDRFRKSNMTAGVYFSSNAVERRILNANNNPNSVLVGNTLNPLALNTAGGNDTITIEDSAVPVDVNSGSGDDTLIVNSDYSAGGDTPASARIVGDDHLFALIVQRGGTLLLDADANLLIGSTSPSFTGTYSVTGTIDVGKNASLAVRRTAATLAGVGGQLRTGYAGGAWNGVDALGTSGAIHSLDANSSPIADTLGYGLKSMIAPAAIGSFALEANDIVVRHTLDGDANLNYSVDFDDLLIVAQNYGQTGRVFAQGNFTYSGDGAVNFDDLLVLAQRYGTSLIQAQPLAGLTKREPAAGRSRSLLDLD